MATIAWSIFLYCDAALSYVMISFGWSISLVIMSNHLPLCFSYSDPIQQI